MRRTRRLLRGMLRVCRFDLCRCMFHRNGNLWAWAGHREG